MQYRRRISLAGLALALLASAGAGTALAAADAGGETRVTRSSFYATDGRAQAAPDKVTLDEAAAGNAAAPATGRRSMGQKYSGARSAAPNTEFWFYTVDVELFGDGDRDGYFHGVDLLFDADTVYESADVYAVLYLSRDGGPWLEYAATDVFPLSGATSDDDFVVVSELVSGYPSGSYDILIELYDTWDGSFVAEIGPESSPDLAYLPLEDQDRDAPPPDVVVVDNGGGAVDPLSLALAVLLCALLVLRRRRQVPHPRRAARRPDAPSA